MKKINKKGLSVGLLDHMAFFVIIVVPFLLIYFFYLGWVTDAVEDNAAGILPDLETQIYQNRLLYSENCFAYSENGRIYTGVIDPNKLTQEVMSSCLPFLTSNERGVEIRIDLEDKEVLLRTQNIQGLMILRTFETNLVPVIVQGQGPKIMRITHTR
jgi:hypothetical protein